MSSFINETFSFLPASSPVFQNGGTYTVPNGLFAIATVYFGFADSGTSSRTISLNGTVILQENLKYGNATSSSDTNLGFSVNPNINGGTPYGGTPFEGKFSGVEENNVTGPGIFLNMQSPNKLTLYLKSGDQLSGNGQYLINLFVNSNSVGFGLKRYNYCPDQTVIATSAYTIPANKNARVLHYFLHQSYTPSSISNYPSVNSLTVNGAVVEYINNRVAWEWYTYYDSKNSVQVTVDYTMKNRGSIFDGCKPVEHFLKAGDVVSGSGSWVAIISLYDVIT